MSEDWERFDAHGCCMTILTKSGLAERGVGIEPEALLMLDLKDSHQLIIAAASIERVRDLVPTFSPARVRYCCSVSEAAEIAAAVDAAARFPSSVTGRVGPAVH